ncbi:MAG: hypothetical protein AB1410_03785 [Acidobacteriota bacterium]
MKRLILSIFFLISLCWLILYTQPKKPDLSGTWLLNKTESQLSGMMIPDNIEMVISHQEPKINIQKIIYVMGQERTQNLSYITDGSETKSEGPRGGTRISKSHWEGEKLIVESTMTVSTPRGEFTSESKETWALSSDGKTLTIDIITKNPRGESTQKQIFNKK